MEPSSTSPSWKMKLPMWATYSRMLIGPVFFVLYSDGFDSQWTGWVAAGLFGLASLTDYLDGYWARKFGAVSDLGKLMDPVADKILVLCALVIFLSLERIDGEMLALLVARDTFVGGLRSAAAARSIIIDAHFTGKWKTAVQMLAIPCLFINEPVGPVEVFDIGYWGLWLSVILSLISGAHYTLSFYRKPNRV